MLVGTCASRRLTGPRPPTCRATLLAAGTNPEALYEDKASGKKRATPEGYVSRSGTGRLRSTAAARPT